MLELSEKFIDHYREGWGLRGRDMTLLESYHNLSFPNTNLTFEWRTLSTQTRLW